MKKLLRNKMFIYVVYTILGILLTLSIGTLFMVWLKWLIAFIQS